MSGEMTPYRPLWCTGHKRRFESSTTKWKTEECPKETIGGSKGGLNKSKSDSEPLS